MLQTKILSISEQPQKVSGIFAAGNEQNLPNSRVHKCPYGVINHRLVVHWEQMLIRDARDRKKPAAGSAGKDHTFHFSLLCLGWILLRCAACFAFLPGTKYPQAISEEMDSLLLGDKSS